MALLNDLTMQQILSRIVGCLIFCALHGLLLATVARAFGNRRPMWEGKLTANPFAHLALPALFMSVLFLAAWIRPMRIEPGETRGGRLALPIVALLSLGLTLAAVPLIDILRALAVDHLPRGGGFAAISVLTETQKVLVVSAVLNLLPLPVLTGRLFLLALAPGLAPRMRRWEPAATVLLLAVLVAGWWPNTLGLLPYLSRL